MATVKDYVELARQAITDGNLEMAQQYKDRAAALKEVEALDPPAALPTDNPEVKALKAEVDALKGALSSEPAVKTAGTLVVTEDETDKKAGRPWESFGHFLKAVSIAAQRPHLTDERLKAQKAILGQGESVQSDGGFLVQPDYATEIFSLEHNAGAVAARCRRIPIAPNKNGLKVNAIDETSRATGSRWGGIRGYWVAEGGTITESTAKFRQIGLELHKAAVVVYATDELLEDTTALGAIIQQGAREEIAFMLDDSIINGTGAGTPLGLLNAVATVSVAKETGQAATTFVYENAIKMWARMWARSRPNAVWFVNQDVETQLFTMSLAVGTGGQPVYLPPGGASAAPYGTLFGRPVIPTEFNASLGTVGDVILADLSQYVLIERGGVNSASSMHVQFLTDQMVYRFVYRVDGQPMWTNVLTPYKGTGNTQSPFVTCATR